MDKGTEIIERCAQCFKVGLRLRGGRCTACLERTPTNIWNEFKGLRLETLGNPNNSESLVSRLSATDNGEYLIARMDMGTDRTMEYYATDRGMIARYTFPVNASNMPTLHEIKAVLGKETKHE